MQSETREWWTKFNYPEDRDRVPLITPEGAAYPHKIREVAAVWRESACI